MFTYKHVTYLDDTTKKIKNKNNNNQTNTNVINKHGRHSHRV